MKEHSLHEVSFSFTARGCILMQHCHKSLITILYNYKLSYQAITKTQTFCVYHNTCSPSHPVTLILVNKFPANRHSPQILTCLPWRRTWSGNPTEVYAQIQHVCSNPNSLFHLSRRQIWQGDKPRVSMKAYNQNRKGKRY